MLSYIKKYDIIILWGDKVTQYRSEEARKRNIDYIRKYNDKNYIRHEARIRQEEEEKLQSILKTYNISFNQFIIESINEKYNILKENTKK